VSRVLSIGGTARSTAVTEAHHSSSRSHAVFTVQLGDGPRMHLVDLAGSERPGHAASREQVKETAYINKSLATLGTVILTLSRLPRLPVIR